MKHYLDYFEENTVSRWEYPAMSDWHGADFTYKDTAEYIAKLHILFDFLGIGEGGRAAICGRNSSRWAMVFLGTVTHRGVAVPILSDFTPEAVAKLVAHSESSVLFTDPKVFDRLDLSGCKDLKIVLSLEDYSILWSSVELPEDCVDAEFGRRYPFGMRPDHVHYCERSLDDLSVINYTSGTTGEPKGVMLTARSISANVNYGLSNIPAHIGDKSLSMLPLAHMFGLAFEFLYAFLGGSHVYFLGKAPGPSTLAAAFSEIRPYILVTVPLVMEKIVKGKVQPVLEKPVMKFLTSIPGVRSIIYKVIRRRFMEALGGKVRAIPLGGAALNPAVEEVLLKLKVPFTVGYGMTECGPLVSYTSWDKFRSGTCGKELGEYSRLRVDSPDPENIPGEIQVKGDNVMVGYFRNPKATSEAFTEDGWLRTGDLGVIGSDGSVSLRGRSKCMILSANGQNIYPEEIEATLNSMPEVDESLVVSREGGLVGLVAPVAGAVEAAGGQIAALADRLREAVNGTLPKYSRLSSVVIMTEPFVHTPKHSIKRSLYANQ
ncbi:MAG: AMP-binding protein [Bacteroidales bacterium]|nr:AMP-binding protein [Bacteroidales bacterium]